MITDIHSLVSGAGKSPTPSSSTPASIGTVAKLTTEIKLIEGLHPIQITSVKNAQSANGTSQLIGISRNDQQQYTLVNSKPDGNLRAGDKGTLNVNGQTATLTISQNQTSSIPSQGQTSTTIQPSSSTPNSQNPIEQANTVRSSNTSQAYAPSSGHQNIAKTIAEVTIASRPITLTVISSNTATQNTASTQNMPSQTAQNAPQQTSNPAVTVKEATLASPQSAAIPPKALNPTPSAQNTVVTSQTNTQASTTQPPNNVQNQPSVKTAVATTIAQTLASIPDTATSKAPAASTLAANTNQTFSALVSDGQEQFTLTTKHPLKAGETLSVIVDKSGQLQFFPTTKATPAEITLTEGLKQSLPKQITPQEFVGMIRQLNTLAQSGAQLPERLSNALNQLVQQLPNIQNLTQSAEGLKQAIQNSGLFSENNLLTKTDNSADLKLNLSRLEGAANEASRQTSGNLSATAAQQQALNMVSGAIERITTHQVRHLVENAQQQDGSMLPLSIEVPIKDGRSTSVVNIRIDKDKEHKADQDAHNRRWLVQLKFDFEETGRFEARASIQDKKVGILFAVEEPSTEQLIRENLGDLRASLRAKQVEIEKLDCFRAKLNETQTKPLDTESKRLIDVRT